MLPPVLSVLLHSSLPTSRSTHLRVVASQVLSHLLTQHSTTYPSLAPRIMKTLLVALLSPGKSKGTREGAVRGLVGVGKEAVRKGLLEGGGARIIGGECTSGDSAQVVAAVLVSFDTISLIWTLVDSYGYQDAFRLLSPPSVQPRPLHPSNATDAKLMGEVGSTLGPFFAARVSPDAEWARGLLSEGVPARSGTPLAL